VSPVNCLLFSWPELKSWQWLSFLLLQPWYVPEDPQLLLMQVELLQGWLLQVRLLRGRLPQGWMLRGPLLRGPLLRGPLLRGPLLRGPLLRGPLLRGPLLRGPLLRGPLLRGPLLRGPLLWGPLLRGPLLGGPLLRGPLLLVLRLLNGEQPFWSPSTPLVSSSPFLFFSHWVAFFFCAYVKWQQLKRGLLLLLWLVCYCSRS
jgi:hypothetical protein